MTVLLDTHAFLWFVLNDPQLSPTARLMIEDPAAQVLLSPASYWEIAIKISRGKYALHSPFEAFWTTGMVDNGIDALAIEVRHAARMLSLPFHHGDPFDRLLAAQALCDGIPLISCDAIFDQCGVTRIW